MTRVLKPLEIFTKLPTSVCIWLNGESSAIQKRSEEIWNGAKYRVATDGAINDIEKRAVEWPHVVCGDFDSIDGRVEMRSAERIHLPDQDKTDQTKAIELCLERKKSLKWSFERIVLLGGLNGRFDHTMATLSTLMTFVNSEEVPIIVVDNINLLIALPEGSSEINLDLKKITRMCGVIPLASKPTVVTSKGLKYEMENLPLAFGQLISTSNEVITDNIVIQTSSPVIFTIELTKN